MSRSSVPDDIQIASMRKKRVEAVDLMVPGSGTPWEDAGRVGYVTAFFKTAWASMLSPVKLLWQIRRPDTTKDATWFSLGCGLMWALSVLIHAAVMLKTYYPKQHVTISLTQYWVNSILLAGIVVGGVWVMLKIASNLYYKLTRLDSASKAPQGLTYNILAYTLGPSIVSIIPYVGPPVALLWIFILWIVAGRQRLKVKTGGVVIASVLTWAALTAIACVVYYGGGYLWTDVMDHSAVTVIEPPKHT